MTALLLPFAAADCDISCVGICYNDYFSVMQYGHDVYNSAAGPGSISEFLLHSPMLYPSHFVMLTMILSDGWPKLYNNLSDDEAAPGPWAAFPILRDVVPVLNGSVYDYTYYDGTQEVTAIVTWGEYGTGEYDYETSNIIDIGVNNNYVPTDCGGPDDDWVGSPGLETVLRLESGF